MPLANAKRKEFRTIGHHLSPVVIVAGDLSDNVNQEIDRALNDHELIKIKVHAADREAKKTLIGEICRKQEAELIQQIGNVALLFRAARHPNPKLSNLLRHRQD